MSKILVLDADSAAGLECLQSLGRRGDKIHVASPDAGALAFRSNYCNERHDQPSHPSQIVSWVEALDRQHGFDLIIPTTERSLLGFMTTECDGELYKRAVLPARESLRLATNKESVWNLANALGIAVPPSVLVSSNSSPDVPFGFPVAVKPIQSKAISGSQMLDFRVSYAANADQLRAAVATVPGLSFQVQKLVRGYGLGIEFLFDNGVPVWHFAHERLHELPLTGGGSSYRRSVQPSPELLSQSMALLKELNWHGVGMVEWKIDPESGPMLMEINPRLWGSLALGIDAGVDFPRGLLAIAESRDPGPQIRYRVPYYTRDLTRDLDWQIANLRANRADPQLLVRPRLVSMIEFLRPLLFQESWDFFDASDLRITFDQIKAYFGLKVSALFGKLRRKLQSRRFERVTHRKLVSQIDASPESFKQILFLCYGNICRSPLAELIAKKELLECEVSSAGFHATENRPSPLHMQRAAAELNIDMEAHRSRSVTAEDIDVADLIVVMDWQNYMQLIKSFPQAKTKVTFLGLFTSSKAIEIEDPYELQGERLHAVVRSIAQGINGLKAKLRF